MNSLQIQRAARWVLERIGRTERIVSFAAFLVLVGVVFADVVSRETTGTGLHWARQAGVYANLVVVMFGIGIASAQGAHLRPRFADGWLPAGWTPVVRRMQDGLMAMFCVVFAWVAIGVVRVSFGLGEQSVVLRTPVWPFQAVIPVVFLLAAFRHGLYATFPALRPSESAGFAEHQKLVEPNIERKGRS